MFKKNLNALLGELQSQHRQGKSRNQRQTNRIDELTQLANKSPQSVSRSDLQFLDAVSSMDLQDAQLRQRYNEDRELRGYQQQVARGQTPLNNERFQQLLDGENARRQKQNRERLTQNVAKTAKGIGLGTAAVGIGATALGTAGAVASATGSFPFSLGLLGGDDASLAAQQYRIGKELEEREFQESLAQRTAVAQTDLDNKLMAMQQRAIFEQNLANSLQRQQAGAIGQGGAGVDVLQKIDSIAAGYMSQGIEPPKAYDLAQNAVRMDGSANSYL